MWIAIGRNLYAYNLPQPRATGNSGPSKDSTLKDLEIEWNRIESRFFPDKEIYTALVDHTVNMTTVTAAPNDSVAAVDIFSGVRGATRRNANRGSQVSLEEGDNIIAIDVTAESRTAQSTHIIEVTKAEAPPVSGGPLPQPQSFQPSSTTSSASQADLAGSSIGLGEGKSRLIFAESLLDGGVRFVFLVPPEELKIETTPDLLSGEWRLLPEDEFQATRESLGNGQDQLTIILPQAEGKQRFLRLAPASPSEEKALEGEFLPREAIFLFSLAFWFCGGKIAGG